MDLEVVLGDPPEGGSDMKGDLMTGGRIGDQDRDRGLEIDTDVEGEVDQGQGRGLEREGGEGVDPGQGIVERRKGSTGRGQEKEGELINYIFIKFHEK